MKVWVLNNEGDADGYGNPDGGPGLSLVGVFSTPENALHYLAKHYLSEETASKVEWTKHHSGFLAGYDPKHNGFYHLTLEEVDHGIG